MTLKLIRFKPGLKSVFKKLINYRFELKYLDDSFVNIENHEMTLNFFNKFGVPLRSSVSNRHLISVYYHHIVRNYRGWRYLRNLPIHGQRT